MLLSGSGMGMLDQKYTELRPRSARHPGFSVETAMPQLSLQAVSSQKLAQPPALLLSTRMVRLMARSVMT